VRDYETVKVEQDILNEYLLVFDDGESGAGPREVNGERRPKGAYYKNIERKMLLKKKRTNVRFFAVPAYND
jgi:RNA polymerase II-associated factor 1